MTLLYQHPDFLLHETGAHPECPARLKAIHQRIAELPAALACTRPEFSPAGAESLLRVHTPEHLAELDALATRGGGRPECDTVVCPASMRVARLAAGAAVDAVHRVTGGQDRQALCLVRPPGHHALADRPMGFCLLNNIAIAAREAIGNCGLDRVLIVDWDVHHGNGAQDLFYRDPCVAFFSIHRWPFYPGTGAADETGADAGLGSTKNLPVEFGVSRDRYLSWFARELQAFADGFRPQLVLVSAGFDAHRLDPIGSLGLETDDFISLTQTVKDIAAAHCQGRVVSLLEGGYNTDVLAECVAAHLTELGED